LADRAARQGQHNPRREIKTDQDSDIRESHPEIVTEQRCNRGHALKLKGHCETYREKNGKDKPAISQSSLPWKSAATWDASLPMSIATEFRCKSAHWHLSLVPIGFHSLA
jgi:hypothetical protein